MWSLLQFISGSIQRNPLSNFMSVLGLFDILYPEKEPLPVPDCTKTYATRQVNSFNFIGYFFTTNVMMNN